jgi:hypothetical protein
MSWKITLEQATAHLEQDLGFNAGNLTAVNTDKGYQVFSYGTLIASRKGVESWITDTKYSITTSKHTNLIKKAWGLV